MKRNWFAGLLTGIVVGLGVGSTLPLWAAKAPADANVAVLNELRELRTVVDQQLGKVVDQQKTTNAALKQVNDNVKTMVDRSRL